MERARLLLFDFDPSENLGSILREILESSAQFDIFLQNHGKSLSDNSGIHNTVSQFRPHVLFILMASVNPQQTKDTVHDIRRDHSDLPIVSVLRQGTPEEILSMLRTGFSDFLVPPFSELDIIPRVLRLLEHRSRTQSLVYTLKEQIGLKQLVGKSLAFTSEIEKIPQLSQCDASVLISGETGTGKELCARAIHYLSSRAGMPFIPVNCGAIPVELVENELFGHVRGAFTGARSTRTGLIHEAHGGTLFLDEIDCLPLPSQAKFLRFLQAKEYRQLGSAKIQQVDVRIIAATNIELDIAIKDGAFRQDLFYRLNIISLTMPPLRKRREDIPLLARHFLSKYASEFNKEITDFTPEALQKLMRYDWPGNVRELENVVERAVVFSQQNIVRDSGLSIQQSEDKETVESFQLAKAKVIYRFEKEYIQNLLLVHQGNITKASDAAQKNRRAFWELIRKHGIDVQSYRSRQP